MVSSKQQQDKPPSDTRPGTATTRVSLACISCRSRHIRCDAAKPACTRCTKEKQSCDYTNSRRGGLDRATLAARRKEKALAIEATSRSERASTSTRGSVVEDQPVFKTRDNTNTPNGGIGGNGDIPILGQHEQPTLPTDTYNPWPSELVNDRFVQIYFKCFHRYHPCVLPMNHLQRYWEDASMQPELKPVVAAIRYIGSMYLRSDLSDQLQTLTKLAIEETTMNSPNSPFLVKAHLLYSICLYWSKEPTRSRDHMDLAVQQAFDLGMNWRNFAKDNSKGDLVLEESWRRTWWQVYIVDSGYAAIKREGSFKAKSVSSTTDLPCEETAYETGDVPPSSTLQDFDNREFAAEDLIFSSFAYLVGLVRGISQALSLIPHQIAGVPNMEAVEAIDAVVDGWLLLLPESKQSVMNKSGEIDELLFYANMALHATVIGFHRSASEIIFNPLEKLSSCAAPAQQTSLPIDMKQIHTTRCLSSIHAQVRLLTLPKRPFCHSPFIICMVVTGMLPYLSACSFLLQGKELLLARERIRLSIGCLKALGMVWTKGNKSVQEIQAIAREILGIGTNQTNQANVASQVNNNSSPRDTVMDLPSTSTMAMNDFSSFGLDEFSTSWQLVNQQLDLGAWFTSYHPA